MQENVELLLENWQKRNIQGIFCATKQEAMEKIITFVPESASVGFSGSVTLDQLGIIKQFQSRGNKVFNPYKSHLNREEGLAIRRLATQADYYLASANAIAQTGELVFFSAYGNRTSGISYAHNVIIVSGKNKIVLNLEEAIKRARDYATPLNCKRLNWNTPCFKDGQCHKEICFYPDYKRMCCQILIIEAEVIADRLKVILVGENLGF
jgi:L-lactate utilization protein LutC